MSSTLTTAVCLPVTTPTGYELRETTRKAGVYCRVGTMDEYVVSECWRSYRTLPVSGRVVLDVGANIGAFSRRAVEGGARLVVAIEPERSNYECLRRNVFDLARVEAIQACAGLSDGETSLWLSPTGRNSGNTSQTRRRGRFEQAGVPVLDVHDLMRRRGVQSVKLDCEGAEYVIGWPHLMPDCVTDVAGELHVNDASLRAKCEEIISAYRDAGWRAVIEPVIKPKAWNTLAHWSR